MKAKHILLFALTLCVGVAFAGTQRTDYPVVKAEFVYHADALSVSAMDLGYVLEVVPFEQTPEFILPDVAKVSKGYAGNVFRPPSLKNHYLIACSKIH